MKTHVRNFLFTTARTFTLLLVASTLATGAVAAQGKKLSFCEYGTGFTSQISSGGAFWHLNWGGGPWAWHECEKAGKVRLFNKHVTGTIRTFPAGPFHIDGNLIFRRPYVGEFVVTAHDNRKNNVGQIIAAVDCIFQADLNAQNAVVDAKAGTITIKFGDVHAKISPTKTTGKFKSICAVDPWTFHGEGTIKIARVPALDVQTNIFLALLTPELLLSGAQETVLSGSYYRTAPK